MMLDLETVNVFLEVAKTGNMSLASQNLYVSQSAISQRISAMEAYIGQTLFHRKYGGMELNRFGNELVEVCKNLKKEIEKLDDWVLEQKNIVKGHLKIITVSSFIDYIFPSFLKEFYKKYNNIKFTINVHTSKYVEEEVLSGAYDLGIIVGKCKKKSLEAIKIMENNVYMVCSKDHFLAKKQKITKKDLEKTKIIWHSEKRSRTVLQIAKKMGFSSIEKIGDIYLSDMESCKNYVLNGIGIAFVADNHIKEELINGDLVKLGGFVIDKPAYLISRKENYQSKLVRVFKQEFIKYCKTD